jgi:hypothetical protein
LIPAAQTEDSITRPFLPVILDGHYTRLSLRRRRVRLAEIARSGREGVLLDMIGLLLLTPIPSTQ